MVVEVEETPPDDPYYDGFVTSCTVCREGLVLILPNYQEGGDYYNCNNPTCSLHNEEGPIV